MLLATELIVKFKMNLLIIKIYMLNANEISKYQDNTCALE